MSIYGTLFCIQIVNCTDWEKYPIHVAPERMCHRLKARFVPHRGNAPTSRQGEQQYPCPVSAVIGKRVKLEVEPCFAPSLPFGNEGVFILKKGVPL